MTAPSLTQYQCAEQELATRDARAGFRAHATVYAAVITILAMINILAVPEFFWFEFPLLGWGLGLFLHYRLGVRGAADQATRRQGLITLAATHS